MFNSFDFNFIAFFIILGVSLFVFVYIYSLIATKYNKYVVNTLKDNLMNLMQALQGKKNKNLINDKLFNKMFHEFKYIKENSVLDTKLSDIKKQLDVINIERKDNQFGKAFSNTAKLTGIYNTGTSNWFGF